MPSASEDYLFVYGTLRSDSGHPMNRTLNGFGGLVGRGRIRGFLYDVGDYPGAVARSEDRAFVCGEVYRLENPARALRSLDRYEGLDPKKPRSGEFRRSRVVVDLGAGKAVRAWIYVYNRPTAGLPRVRSGDYFAPRNK